MELTRSPCTLNRSNEGYWPNWRVKCRLGAIKGLIRHLLLLLPLFSAAYKQPPATLEIWKPDRRCIGPFLDPEGGEMIADRQNGGIFLLL